MQDHQRPEPKEKQTSTLKRILMLLLALAVIAGSIFGYLIPNGRADNQPVSRQEFKMLQKGNSGAAVREMQEALQRLGYYDGKADGNFSHALEDAVRALQQDLDVSPTGKIDYDTYLLLYAELDGEAPSAAPTASPGPAATEAPFVVKGESYSDKEHVAAYLRLFGELPENYITKAQARKLGWVSSQGNLWKVAPGKSIGGDTFGNYEGLLPSKQGRRYYECDIDFDGTFRNGKRIIFSSDGLIYYTDDHYASFEEMKP